MGEDLRVGAANYDYSGFEDMLLDEDRNVKYRKAIELAVQQKLKEEGKAHVLDIGSGTGLLSLYAAKSGATSVTSIELDPVIFKVSVAISKRANFGDKIKFINKESLELDKLPQKANILVSEIFDSELLGENVLRTFEHALQNLTTQNVICIPNRADVFVAPIESKLLAQQCQLPKHLNVKCDGNLNGIDSHWLTSGKKTFDFVCKPMLLKSFIFNDLKSLKLEDTQKLEFKVGEDVKQIDGIILWWDLDLSGDGKWIITTGTEKDKPRWRNHWLPMGYGLTRPIEVSLNDEFCLIGSHDEVLFWFDIKQNCTNIDEFNERKDCTCGWHSNLSPSTIMLWNSNYEKSNFVELAKEESVDKNVVCIGTRSLLPTFLKAKKSIVVEASDRFCDKLSEFCQKDTEFVRDISKIDYWDKIDIVIFDIYPNDFSSPIDFAKDYSSISNHHKNVKLIPEKLELNAIPVKFENLWRRKMRVKQIDEFDYTDFDNCFGKTTKTLDSELELLPLWEEQCYKRGDSTTIYSFHSNVKETSSHDLQIPTDSDAFVFYFSSSHNQVEINKQFEETNGQIEWKQGCCQWIYFLTKPKSKMIKIEFDQSKNVPSFCITDL